MARLCLALAIVAAAACATAPATRPEFPVGGSEAGLADLAGTWFGQYWSGATERSGTIRFELEAGASLAEGRVWMIAAKHPGTPAGPSPSGVVQALEVSFVRVEDRIVSGTLEPYRDPGCGCWLSTTFTGTLGSGRIGGTFLSRGPAGHAATAGSWSVELSTAP